jgi:hypothetical protein
VLRLAKLIQSPARPPRPGGALFWVLLRLKLDTLGRGELAVFVKNVGFAVIARMLEAIAFKFPPTHRPMTISRPQLHDFVPVPEPGLPQFVRSLEERAAIGVGAKPKLQQNRVVALLGGVDGALRFLARRLAKPSDNRGTERRDLAAQNQAVELGMVAP